VIGTWHTGSFQARIFKLLWKIFCNESFENLLPPGIFSSAKLDPFSKLNPAPVFWHPKRSRNRVLKIRNAYWVNPSGKGDPLDDICEHHFSKIKNAYRAKPISHLASLASCFIIKRWQHCEGHLVLNMERELRTNPFQCRFNLCFSSLSFSCFLRSRKRILGLIESPLIF